MNIIFDYDYEESGDASDEIEYTVFINEIKFNNLEKAQKREREPLARSTTSINMNGFKK